MLQQLSIVIIDPYYWLCSHSSLPQRQLDLHNRMVIVLIPDQMTASVIFIVYSMTTSITCVWLHYNDMCMTTLPWHLYNYTTMTWHVYDYTTTLESSHVLPIIPSSIWLAKMVRTTYVPRFLIVQTQLASRLGHHPATGIFYRIILKTLFLSSDYTKHICKMW